MYHDYLDFVAAAIFLLEWPNLFDIIRIIAVTKGEARMKTAFAVALALMAAITISPSAFAKGPSGKALFQKHCASCHANGGNMDNPEYTLHKKDLKKHGVKTAKDIVGKMRHPGPGMPAFSKEKISDSQAKAIASYIMKTFK